MAAFLRAFGFAFAPLRETGALEFHAKALRKIERRKDRSQCYLLLPMFDKLNFVGQNSKRARSP